MNQFSSQGIPVELVEVKIAQFVVADLVGKHVIDGHQDLMGYSYDCPLVPAPSFETVKLVSQVGAFGFCCSGGGLHQCCLQIHITLRDATALALASRFMVSRTYSSPRCCLQNTVEHAHVHAQFSDDRCRDRPVHARNLIQQGKLCLIGLQLLLEALLQNG